MKSKKRTYKNKKLPIAIAAIVILGCLGGGYALVSATRHKTSVNAVNKTAGTSTANPNTHTSNSSPKYPNPYVASPTPTTNVPGGGKGTNTTPSSGTSLVAPFGQFVSNYGPISYSATDGSNQEESVCQTTIGAMCSIVFIQGQTTKALKALQVSSANGSQNGVASWSWTPNEVGGNGGLTPGQWQVEAIATLDNKTKTTVTNIKLNIQP